MLLAARRYMVCDVVYETHLLILLVAFYAVTEDKKKMKKKKMNKIEIRSR